VLVLVLEKWGWASEVLEYCALFELHPRSGLKGAEGAPDWGADGQLPNLNRGVRAVTSRILNCLTPRRESMD
jgi:hypothetical protein